MTKNRNLIIPAVVAGVLLIALAILYFADSADALPSFIPGHEAGSSHHHVKHGIAALCLGLGRRAAVFPPGPRGGPVPPPRQPRHRRPLPRPRRVGPRLVPEGSGGRRVSAAGARPVGGGGRPPRRRPAASPARPGARRAAR